MFTRVWATVTVPQDRGRIDRGAGQLEPSEVADAVRRAAAGDKVAWDSLVESFTGLIWSVASRHRLSPADCAEVVQTTWLRLLENLAKINQPERVGGWLSTTARHESLRLLRLRGREFATDDESTLDRDSAPDAPTPESVVLDRDRNRRLWRAFARLPERCRVLLDLVVIVSPPYTEVAAALHMPIGSIGPTRARCLQQLRRLLGEDGMGPVAGAGAG